MRKGDEFSVIGVDGQVYGPVRLDMLKTWCAEGRITADSNLIDASDGSVVPAGRLPQLVPYLPPGASPQAAPVSAPHAVAYSLPGQRSKIIAIVLAFFLGPLGVHRFYLGHNNTGLAMLILTVVTCGIGAIVTGIWALIDIIMIAFGSMLDGDGRPLKT